MYLSHLRHRLRSQVFMLFAAHLHKSRVTNSRPRILTLQSSVAVTHETSYYRANSLCIPEWKEARVTESSMFALGIEPKPHTHTCVVMANDLY